jgi:hypothetical protein
MVKETDTITVFIVNPEVIKRQINNCSTMGKPYANEKPRDLSV